MFCTDLIDLLWNVILLLIIERINHLSIKINFILKIFRDDLFEIKSRISWYIGVTTLERTKLDHFRDSDFLEEFWYSIPRVLMEKGLFDLHNGPRTGRMTMGSSASIHTFTHPYIQIDVFGIAKHNSTRSYSHWRSVFNRILWNSIIVQFSCSSSARSKHVTWMNMRVAR